MIKKTLLISVLILGTTFLLSGCKKDQQSTEANVEENNEGKKKLSKEELANPASVFCVENGGTSEIRNNEFGETGYCIFDDGSECEEWSFFQSECKKGENKKKNEGTNKDDNKEEDQESTTENNNNEQ